MIEIRTQNSDEYMDEIKSKVIGKQIKWIDLGKINTSSYAKNPEDTVSRISIFFTDGSRLLIGQDQTPIDDEDEHSENPLIFEYGK